MQRGTSPINLDAQMRDFPRLREKLEVLNGDRGNALQRAAVRRGNLAELSRLEPKSARTAGTTPTAEEIDLVVDDIAAIMSALRVVASMAGK